MKKPDIAKRMARAEGVSTGEAADRLDRVVRDILSNLRKGKETALPGLGRFTHGPNGQVAFKRELRGSHER
jgi:nucleoid DNA-binding protein